MERADWLAWRKLGLGSSDAPIVMGVSKFKTRLQLWEDKLNPNDTHEENNFITDMGNDIEPKIRRFFECEEGMAFPAKNLEMSEINFLRASLDGCNEDGTIILEIKMLGQSDFDLLKNHTCPPQYFPQVQHQLMVSGAEVCVVAGFLYKQGDNREVTHDRFCVHEVYPDAQYIEKLHHELCKFWKEHVLKKVPPEVSDGDFKNLKGLTPWVNKWKKAKAKLAELDSIVKEAETYIKSAAEAAHHPRLMANGVRIVQVSKVGSVDYESIPQLKGVALDQFRKPGSSYWKLDVPKNKEEKNTDGKKTKKASK